MRCKSVRRGDGERLSNYNSTLYGKERGATLDYARQVWAQTRGASIPVSSPSMRAICSFV